MDKVKEVKQAILKAEGHEEWDELAPHWEEIYTKMARAAIEAMREPTDKMIDVADFPGLQGDVEGIILRNWWAMINAALNAEE